MRLKVPATTKKPNNDEAKTPERFCGSLAACAVADPERIPRLRTNLVFHDTLYQDQAPAHDQRLQAVGEGMCLEGPRHVRRRDEQHSDASGASRLHQLLYCPVLKHDAQREHQHAQRPVDDRRRDLSVSETLPEPAQYVHGPAVCEP